MKKGIIAAVIILAALLAAGSGAFFWYQNGKKQYEGVFLPGTSINGRDVSGMTPEVYAETAVQEATEGEFTVLLKDGTAETFSLREIVDTAKPETDPAEFLSEEDLKRWPLAVRETRSFDDPVTVTFDDEKIRGAVHALSAISGEGVTAPENAYFTKTDQGFTIVPETEGTLLDEEKVFAAVRDAIDSGIWEADLAAADCYVKASVTSEDPGLAELLARARTIQNTVITMDMTNALEVVDFSVFGLWIDWDGTDFVLNEDALAEYVESLNKKYWTYQTERYFVTHGGQTITVGGGARDTYGFWMNTDATAETLKNALLSWESQDILPAWRVNALTRGQDNGDIGGTYVEISLAQQHMWFYKGYEQVFDTDVTTGTASNPERATPTGVFCILSKLPDHTMTGTYGSQFCHYYMCFDWTGCGIHDASWRSSFGGDIYLTNGSHGCVNTPPDKMKELWDMIYTATPVIIY